MLLSELAARAMELLRECGDMKVYIGDDDPTRLLMRPVRVNTDCFCPECDTKYCEIYAVSASEEYFSDGPCCAE